MRHSHARLRWHLALVGLLCLAGVVQAQARQRIFVPPQVIHVGGAKPAICRGACLDEKIPAAPTKDDRIVRFSDPGAIVVRKFENGKETGTQDWGKTAPKDRWVEFRGAQDVTGGFDLQVVPVGAPPKGTTFRVEVSRGLATARAQEQLDKELADRLKGFAALTKSLDAQFEALKALDGASPLTAALVGYAQKEVCWAQPGDAVTPEKAREQVEKFVQSLVDSARADDPRLGYLMACALAGGPVAGHPDRVAYFRRFGVDAAKTPSEEKYFAKLVEAAAEAGRVELPGTEGAARVRALRGRVETLLKLTTGSEPLQRLVAKMARPTIGEVEKLHEKQSLLEKPSVVKVTAEKGKPLVLEHHGEQLDLTKLLEEARGPQVPLPWKALAGPASVIDVRGLSGADFHRLYTELTEIGNETRLPFQGRFALGGDASLARNRRLLDIDTFDVRVGGDTFKRVELARKVVAELLGQLGFKDPQTGRSVEFVVAHEDGKVLESLRKKAEDGAFKDKHLVLVICLPESNRQVFEEFTGVAQKALDRGAASVLMPTCELDIRGMTLFALVLKHQPALLENATPKEVLLRCRLETITKLEDCLQNDNPLEALKKEFGNVPGLEELFKNKDGEFDRPRAESTLDSLKKSTELFQELVRRDAQPRQARG